MHLLFLYFQRVLPLDNSDFNFRLRDYCNNYLPNLIGRIFQSLLKSVIE